MHDFTLKQGDLAFVGEKKIAALTVDFRKYSGPTPADDMAAQIITDCGSFTLDFKQHGLPPDSGTLISKGNAKLL